MQKDVLNDPSPLACMLECTHEYQNVVISVKKIVHFKANLPGIGGLSEVVDAMVVVDSVTILIGV